MEQQPQTSPKGSARALAFAGLCVVTVLAVGAYLYAARQRTRTAIAPGFAGAIGGTGRSELAALRSGSYVAFRNTVQGPDYGKLSFTTLEHPASDRYTTTLPCNRLYFGGNSGLCLVAEPIRRQSSLGYLLDHDLAVAKTLSTRGVPSRVRVSRDGRRAAYTVFVTGDSYMGLGFSTRTRILDVASGEVLADLESLDAMRGGKVFTGSDFNYWGVTFGADPNSFYATLGTQGQEFLVQGDLTARRMAVIRPGVECPSLSPDETRIAFKKKVSQYNWRPAILNIATGDETVLAESRNVDDQIEWLDDRHIIYAVRDWAAKRMDVWMSAVDGQAAPVLFIPNAESPSVVRTLSSDPVP